MPRINERVINVILARLRAGEAMDSVIEDYWLPDLREPALHFVHQSDLAAMLERLLALDAWAAAAVPLMRDSAATLATAGQHEQAARVLTCINTCPVQFDADVPQSRSRLW